MANCHKVIFIAQNTGLCEQKIMLQPWKHAESNNQFQNSSELIQKLVYFMTLCHGWLCMTYMYVCQLCNILSSEKKVLNLQFLSWWLQCRALIPCTIYLDLWDKVANSLLLICYLGKYNDSWHIDTSRFL